MKSVFILLILITGISSSAQQKKFFSVKGKEVIGVDGKPFHMRGTNLGNWLVPEGYMFKFGNVNSPRLINQTLVELIGEGETRKFWNQFLENYITAEDIRYLKSIGMNSIRIPFNYRLFTTEDYMGGEGEARGFSLLDRVINWCRQEKLYVLLDMHCAPGGQTGDNIDDGAGYPFLFDDESSQALTTSIWKKIANHYKNDEIIIGYDLLNEPIAHFFDSAHFNPKLEPFYKRVTKAIREVDKNHLIFLGGSQWNSNFRPFGTPFDDKLVYTFHKYWTDATKEVIQPYLDFSEKYNVPLYCGETGENTDEWVMTFRKVLDSNNVGWHFWPYKKIDNTRGIVQFQVPKFYEQVITYAQTPKKNFEDIRKARPTNMAEIKKALDGFLENCKFKNCTGNKGYIQALGFFEPQRSIP
ncbi:MAG TPA: glycoside hydrolase family 5 protein [Chitinophagaceae bacterium]|nr:glycoside hydrolase family 5 protein [Chitinophagaceae bacterium]